MTENVVAPQSFTGASNFNIANSVFVASNNATFQNPPIQAITPQVSAIALFSSKSGKSSCVEAEWDVYARLLLPRKRGYPLWEPKPDEHLPEEYRRIGVCIGDVGILNEFGGFDYLFNACLPADHPVNAGRVPPDFKQLKGINARETTKYARRYRPGDHVPNHASQIHKTRISSPGGQQQISGIHSEVAAGLSFRSSATRGAFVVLPEGASQTDHQLYNKLYQYAAECARSWYTYVNGPLARGAHNGSLYLVTGCDKARAWGVASFIDARPDNVLLDVVPQEPENAGGLPDYWFSTCNSASSSSDSDNVFNNESGCIFLRGLKIAIQIPLFPMFSEVAAKVTPISQLGPDDCLPQSRSAHALQWLQSYLTPKYDYKVYSDLTSDKHESGLFSIVRQKEYHPSNVINDWILSHSDVEVAITHDDDWASLIQDDEEEMPDNEDLIRRVRENCKIIKFRCMCFVVHDV
ncbi:hypothetical protein J3R30DRAFT_892546 [Lentinula aciculospora]|uniref:Uncharacterized protein n=1 Tax=Lentinula aciculospora TaxID=153920 RepID=A0A9W9DWB4_9AGAR|nr:hypothetical protein J3R30DRAFT_892546 [Lentinula aciculospora]